MRVRLLAVAVVAACGWLTACASPAPPPVAAVAPSPTVYTASFICQNGNTPVQNAVCGNQQLAALDVEMAGVFRHNLARASLFGRDQLLADQRGWLLGLPEQCNVTGAAPGTDAVACLVGAYQAQTGVLSDWPVPPGAPLGAMTKYVTYQVLDSRQPALCGPLEAQAAGAMSDDGSLDPARLNGAVEIAGSHGGAGGALAGGGAVDVALYDAGLFGSYQRRARGVTLDGKTVVTPDTLGAYVESLPNGGGRFVSFASQTNDYGDIDVFTLGGQPVALVTDAIGYDSPAPPGEAAVEGLYTLAGGAAAPACLFHTYLTPPPLDESVFGAQPTLTPFLAVVDAMHAIPTTGLAPSDRQDSAKFADETSWTMLNMPLVGVAQATQGDWVNWLRHRHDDVLGALYDWSSKSQENQAEFTRLFALLRPAAVELDMIYVQRQGLSAAQAQQATALAMMEFLYEAAGGIAPGIGGTPENPAAEEAYAPRYPILASPGPAP